MTTTRPPAYTPAQRARIVAIGTGVPVLVAVIGIAVLLGWTDLPDPIAIHWGGDDIPDGFGSVAGLAWLIASTGIGFGLLATIITVTLRAGSRGSFVPRVLIATSVWLSVFLTVGIGGTVAIQRGLSDAADAGSPVVPMLLALVIALPPAVAAWFATPRAAIVDAAPETTPRALDLGVDERAVWVRSVRPARTVVAVLVVSGLIVVAAAAFALLTEGAGAVPFLIAPVVILLVAVTMLFWRVRVDTAGLVARAAVGFPRISIPIASIASARVVQVDSIPEFGGWGVRLAPGRFGIILRGGEALEVERLQGRRVVITVADATTAVALLNGLIARAAVSRGSR